MDLKKYISLIPVIFFFLIGCHRNYPEKIDLERAESLIMSHPDSSLLILEEIDTMMLRGEREKALYGLLYTMALDKNHLNPNDEGLISGAAEYFGRKGDKRNEMIALHYLGRVRYLKEEYPEAVVSFFKAKEIAENTEDYFYAGLACRGISDSFINTSNIADELEYARKEYEYFQKSGVQPYLNYSLLDLCRALNNNACNEEVISRSEELMDSAFKYQNEKLYFKAMSYKAMALIWTNDYTGSLRLFKEIYDSGYANSSDSLYYGYSLWKMGYKNEGREIIERKDLKSDPLNHLYRYKVYKEEKKLKKAMEEIEVLEDKTDKIDREQSRIKLSSTLSNYFELEKKLAGEKLKLQKYKTGFILTLSIFGGVLLIITVIYFYKKYRRETEQKILFAEQLEDQLEINRVKDMEHHKLMTEFLGKHYGLLREAGELLYRSIDKAKTRREISSLMNSFIESLSIGGNGIVELATQIDKTYDNLASDLKINMPSISDSDYLLYLYSVAKFSPSLISVLLKVEKVEIVYNRKRHLKSRIKKLDSIISERFLQYL